MTSTCIENAISSCAWMGTRVTMKSCRKMTAVFRDRCHIQEIMNRSWRHVSRKYVVSEDRDLLLEKASMNNVLDVLEREGELMVSYGEKGMDGRYARKLLRYVYFDRQERKILLMRQDITAEYLEQRRQKKRLSDALLHARIDSLTGLYNRQAVNAKINGILREAAVMPPSVLLLLIWIISRQ